MSVALGFLIGWLVRQPSADSEQSQQVSSSDAHSLQQATSLRPDGRASAADRSRPSFTSDESDPKPLDLLEKIADSEMSEYFFVPVFSRGLTVNMSLIEKLGLDVEQGKQLETDIRAVFDDIRNAESRNFEVLTNENDKVILSVPAIESKTADLFKNRIQESFAAIFPEKLATKIVTQFLTEDLALTGAVLGRDRLLQIEIADGDSNPDPSRKQAKYNLKTVVLGEGFTHKYYDERGLDAFSHKASWDESVEKLPEQWSHLFEAE